MGKPLPDIAHTRHLSAISQAEAAANAVDRAIAAMSGARC